MFMNICFVYERLFTMLQWYILPYSSDECFTLCQAQLVLGWVTIGRSWYVTSRLRPKPIWGDTGCPVLHWNERWNEPAT